MLCTCCYNYKYGDSMALLIATLVFAYVNFTELNVLVGTVVLSFTGSQMTIIAYETHGTTLGLGAILG